MHGRGIFLCAFNSAFSCMVSDHLALTVGLPMAGLKLRFKASVCCLGALLASAFLIAACARLG